MYFNRIISYKRQGKKLLALLLLSLLLVSCSMTLPAEKQRPDDWAVAVESTQLQNFYRVDNKLYRSAQPSNKGMQALQKRGIKHVLNLRYFHSDKDEANGVDIKTHRVRMLAHYITYPQLVQALRIIKQADQPIVVHCLQGSDRTGAVVAAYRMVFQNWSKQKAIHELKLGGYGFHHTLFPNIPELLQALDIVKLRSDVLRDNIKSMNEA